MITEVQYNELKADLRLREATANLMKFFDELELTPSVNIESIKQDYKVVLFHKLLKIDKGARMRYEMHKTEKSKLKMIDEFVSLEGYDEISEIAEAIQIYKGACNSSCLHLISALNEEKLLKEFRGDIAVAAQPYVVNTSLDDNPVYIQLQQLETIVNRLYESGALPPSSYRNPWDLIKTLIPSPYGADKVQIDDVRAYYYIKNNVV